LRRAPHTPTPPALRTLRVHRSAPQGRTPPLCSGKVIAHPDGQRHRPPTQHLQTDDVCFMRLPLYTSFGIPTASMANASLTPTAILKDFPTKTYVNINLAAPVKLTVPTSVSHAVPTSNVWEYTMKLDVSALTAANGTSTAGRTATIKAAQLALPAISRNMDDISDGNYRLKVTFTGLPSPYGLPGPQLTASTD